MSRSRRNQVSLGIAGDAICVMDANQMQALTSLPLADYLPGAAAPASADWAHLLDAALAQTGELQGGELSITLADAWVRYFMLNVPGGTSNLFELQALALDRFESLFGMLPKGWRLEADWQAQGQILVCAVPDRLLEVARTLNQAGAWRVRSIQPYALRLFNHYHAHIPADGWLCCFTADSVLALLLVRGAVWHVRRFLFKEVPDAESVQAQLVAEMLRLGYSVERSMCAVGVLPEMPTNGRVGKLKLILPHQNKMPLIQPGEPEAPYLAALGALA